MSHHTLGPAAVAPAECAPRSAPRTPRAAITETTKHPNGPLPSGRSHGVVPRRALLARESSRGEAIVWGLEASARAREIKMLGAHGGRRWVREARKGNSGLWPRPHSATCCLLGPRSAARANTRPTPCRRDPSPQGTISHWVPLLFLGATRPAYPTLPRGCLLASCLWLPALCLLPRYLSHGLHPASSPPCGCSGGQVVPGLDSQCQRQS